MKIRLVISASVLRKYLIVTYRLWDALLYTSKIRIAESYRHYRKYLYSHTHH